MAGGGGFDPSAWLWTACITGALLLLGFVAIFPSAFREWWPRVFSNFGPDARPLHFFVYRGEGTVPRNVVRVEVHRSVEEIPHHLFEYCTLLDSLILHPGLLRIGSYAFEGCSSLIRVEIPDGLLRIGERAFGYCTSLRSFRCPATVTAIGESVFDGCWNLAEVVLPDGLEEIEDSTFNGCRSLREVRIPATVARIGYGVFNDCTSLRLVELREGLRWIVEWAFIHCSSLESLLLPSSVEDVGEEAFDNCSSLTSVQLHENLPRIGRHAFRRCTSLQCFWFVPLSARMEAVALDDQAASMFEDRLSEITAAMTEVNPEEEEEDDDEAEEEAKALWERCKISLGRAHKVLNYWELKGAAPILELALWKAKIEGQGGGGVRGELIADEERGQDLSDAARKKRRLKLVKDVGQDSRLSRTDCRVKCGAGIVFAEVLKFFAYRRSWPQLDDEAQLESTG